MKSLGNRKGSSSEQEDLPDTLIAIVKKDRNHRKEKLLSEGPSNLEDSKNSLRGLVSTKMINIPKQTIILQGSVKNKRLGLLTKRVIDPG